MKIVPLLILPFLMISGLSQAQIKITEGAKKDTITRTKEYRVTLQPTSRGEEIRLQNLTPSENSWNFQAAYGMAFGDQTTFNFIPQVSYSQSVYFHVGGGLNYIYYYLSHKGNKEKMNYMGLNVFARLTPLPYLAFQVQPELLARWGKQNSRKVSGRLVPTLLAGGGFVIPAGPGDVVLLFLFDIIQNTYTPYGKNLYYTIGYSFPF